MDSRLFKIAMLSSLAMILVVSALVLYTNGGRGSGIGGRLQRRRKRSKVLCQDPMNMG